MHFTIRLRVNSREAASPSALWVLLSDTLKQLPDVSGCSLDWDRDAAMTRHSTLGGNDSEWNDCKQLGDIKALQRGGGASSCSVTSRAEMHGTGLCGSVEQEAEPPANEPGHGGGRAGSKHVLFDYRFVKDKRERDRTAWSSSGSLREEEDTGRMEMAASSNDAVPPALFNAGGRSRPVKQAVMISCGSGGTSTRSECLWNH